jgi:dCMP deaminase
MADVIAQRSACSRDKVGAVVVDAQNRIVDTGYNGPPAGYNPVTAAWPADMMLPCTNWCPRAAKRPGDPQRAGDLYASDYSDCPSLHAEANALMFSDRRLRVGGTIYVSSGMCHACAKLIANSGLVRVVYRATDIEFPHRNTATYVEFLEACGLEVVGVAK